MKQKNPQVSLKVLAMSVGFECILYLIFSKNEIKKPPSFLEGFRGIVRIRTAVGAFAEPSLATRPRRPNRMDGKSN